jgi:predicted ABC-type sugar transport system permease subunit
MLALLGGSMRALVRRYLAWIAVVLVYGIAAIVSPAMLKLEQILNILQVTAFLGLVATAQTFALSTRGIDLSVAGVVTMTNIVATSLMLGQESRISPAVFFCLLVRASVGARNGILVAVLRVAPAGIETHVLYAAMRDWIFVKAMTDEPDPFAWGKATSERRTQVVVGTVQSLTLLRGRDPRRTAAPWIGEICRNPKLGS